MNKQEVIEAAKNIPWANWIAQDGDGEWWAYEKMPIKMHDHWTPSIGSKAAAIGVGDLSIVFEVIR